MKARYMFVVAFITSRCVLQNDIVVGCLLGLVIPKAWGSLLY